MNLILKTDFSDARVEDTNDLQWDKLVLPAGEIPIMYEAGTPEDRNAWLLTDPSNNSTALSFEIYNATIPGDREGYYKGRVQLNCALPDAESVTMKASMLLDLEAYRSYPKANGWFTIIELWAGAANSPMPFRMSVNLMKDAGESSPIFWSVAGSKRDLSGMWRTAWSRTSRLSRPPLREFFDIDLMCRKGRLNFSMAGRTVFDVTTWIPVPFTMIQPCKLYTSGAVIDHMREAGKPARILWDSLEIST